MDAELDRRLATIEKLVADNNKMLTKMRNAQRNAIYLRIVYWALLLGLTLASFYFIQPYISQLGAAYGIGGTKMDSSGATSATEGLLDLVKQYQATQNTGQ